MAITEQKHVAHRADFETGIFPDDVCVASLAVSSESSSSSSASRHLVGSAVPRQATVSSPSCVIARVRQELDFARLEMTDNRKFICSLASDATGFSDSVDIV